MTLPAWSTPVIRRDKRALKILTETYWSSAGWKSKAAVHPDADYARRAGYLYDELPIGHDEAVSRAIEVASGLGREAVANAFLASLSSRRLELRSALGSYALAMRLPNHRLEGEGACPVCCLCGPETIEDFGIQNFERYRWGGVRHDSPPYMWFDLSLFAKTEPLEATESDVKILRTIVETVLGAPPSARPGDLDRSLVGLFPSNSDERRVLLQILSYAGILEPAGRPVFSDSWVDCDDREPTRDYKNDWTYPMLWWRGVDGINQAQLRHFFPDVAMG